MMSEPTFDAKLRHIEEQYQARREGADAYRDQEMARLFGECGWTQERIAARMGKRQQWVSYRLIFGRFLDFTTTGCKASLTERRFREHWKLTTGKESERFAEVAHRLEHGIPQGFAAIIKKPGIRLATLDALADGKAYTISQLAATVEETLVGITETQITEAIGNIRRHPPEGQELVVKKIGKKCQYKLRRRGAANADPADTKIIELYEAAAPLIEELRHWGHAHRYSMAPGEILKIAVKLERLFQDRMSSVKA